jgi:hypothetical protein
MPPSAAKYAPLTRHLAAQTRDAVAMSFADIERVLGAKLPPSARALRSFWSNNAANNVMTQAWLAAGFRSAEVDLAVRRLTFRRAASAAAFNEAPTPYLFEEPKMQSSPFGCMAGTVVVNADLTEPADPDLAAYLDEAYGPVA